MLRVVLPIVARNDREGLDTAFYLLRRKPPEQLGIARIHDTMRLEHLLISESLLPQVRENPKLEVLEPPEALRFDGAGNLLPDELGAREAGGRFQ